MKTQVRSRRSRCIASLCVFSMALALVAAVAGCGLTQYEVTFSSTAGGSVTAPGEGTFYYEFGAEVSLVASPDSGYRFVSWAGGGAPIADVTSATTAITSVQGSYDVKAYFELTGPAQYTLTISSTTGGSVTTPGEGAFTIQEDTVVTLVANPTNGYRFVNWTGNVGTITNASAASTTITMNDDYSIVANFEAIPPDQYSVAISSSTGGSVTTPGEGTFAYAIGSVVDLVAMPSTGYRFVNWTGSVGTVANVNASSTTIAMNGNYSITANFEAEEDGVAFADPNLEAAVRAAISKPTGPIEHSDLLGLLFLDASERSIVSLAGLEHCTNLKYLFLVGNQISDLSPLAGLAKLERLLLGSNQISNLTPLSSLTNLAELGLWDNQISNISPLANLTSLTGLWLGGNQISNLAPLTNLTNLLVLYLWSNQISDINPLVLNTGLGNGDYVDLRWNPLSSSSTSTYIPQLQARGVDVQF